MICTDCTSYLRMLTWRWLNNNETCCRNKILTFVHCCCVLTVTLKHSVLLLEFRHNGMSSIKKKNSGVFFQRCPLKSSSCGSAQSLTDTELKTGTFFFTAFAPQITEDVNMFSDSIIDQLTPRLILTTECHWFHFRCRCCRLYSLHSPVNWLTDICNRSSEPQNNLWSSATKTIHIPCMLQG